MPYDRSERGESNSRAVSGSDRVEGAVAMPVESSDQAWGKSGCEDCITWEKSGCGDCITWGGSCEDGGITWGRNANSNECDSPTRQDHPLPPRTGDDARVGVDSAADEPERALATKRGVLGKRCCEREEYATEPMLTETEHKEIRDAESAMLTTTKGANSLPFALFQRPLLMCGGRTVAARRRQGRAEQPLAVVHGLLAAELREKREERAKILRTMVPRVISGLDKQVDACTVDRRRRVAQRTVKVVRKATARAAAEHSALLQWLPARTVFKTTGRMLAQPKRVLSDDEWLRQLEAYSISASRWLTEEGCLAEMGLARWRALKEAKPFQVAKRARRLQQRQDAQERNSDKVSRVAPLRDDGYSEGPNSLPTVMLAISKSCILKARFDTCVAGIEQKKFGRCIRREASVEVVEGFGGGSVRVLGIWQSTTRCQQQIVVNALLVDGQACEFLIGEDWMLEHQVKLNFAKRECKYRDEMGQKITLHFWCHSESLPVNGG
ncbi:unnamed protein product [Phytophthora fragariaefolia]|uniref:Unnamed protein product n=1 Tax=Phytophthora fragariaefolia TaxID=1490495 RepID=A0A9W6YH63_9STRA|nr:unnamed protein product [Phytophthora fragariaefolia]